MGIFKSAGDLSDFVKRFDLSGADITTFGAAAAADVKGLQAGDTITLGPMPVAQRFDGYTNPGMDSPTIKRGAKVEMHEVAGVSGSGVVTGRYRLRDGRVHFWGIVNV